MRKICVVVFALRRSVSFYSSLANWNLSNSRSLRTSPQTGVAIPRIGVPFLDNIQVDSGKQHKKNGMYDDGLSGIRGRFPHPNSRSLRASDHWLAMTHKLERGLLYDGDSHASNSQSLRTSAHTGVAISIFRRTRSLYLGHCDKVAHTGVAISIDRRTRSQ